jgi:hypothetical protein
VGGEMQSIHFEQPSLGKEKVGVIEIVYVVNSGFLFPFEATISPNDEVAAAHTGVE